MAEISTTYEIGEGLKVVGANTLEVDTTDTVESSNRHPLTSNGAAIEIGNLDALLGTV